LRPRPWNAAKYLSMNQLTPSNDKNFLASLHGLRGIAALYVVFSHLGNGGLFLLPIPHDAVGKVGVWIFFCLSAFLLTTNLCLKLESTSSKTTSILQYAAHRVFRIYPLYVVVLIIHFSLGDIDGDGLFRHLALLQGRGELWAIPTEFQYYLAIPFIALAAIYWGRAYVNLMLLAALLGALIYGTLNPASIFSNELNIFPKIAPFVLGSIFALFARKNLLMEPRKIQLVLPWICLAGLLAVTVLYRFIAKGQISDIFAPYLSIAIGAAATGLIYAALKTGPINTLLASKPLVSLGKISFSLYLLHMFAIQFVQKFSGLSPTGQAWLSMAAAISCACLSYLLIELPGISAGKAIGKKIEKLFVIGCKQSNITETNAS